MGSGERSPSRGANYTSAAMHDPWARPGLVALDTGSPLLSVAIGSSEEIRTQVEAPASRSSAAVMSLFDRALTDAGMTVKEIGALIVLTGPGSFTGLRVGLALAMGLRQALGVPVGAVSTLQTLAAAGPGDVPQRVVAAVRAGRARWNVGAFTTGSPSQPLDEPQNVSDEELVRYAASTPLVGFGLEDLELSGELAPSPVTPPPLAGIALSLAPHVDWSASLAEPLYMAPPPADPRARIDTREG